MDAPAPRMISWAQNHEDVVLARAFAGAKSGFYVDVGAMHPTSDSVTKHFYDLGWSGINVEPSSEYHALLVAERPRDTNLCLALGREPGRALLHRVVESGLSSLDAEVRDEAARSGRAVVEESVEVVTLASLCAEHVRGEIDFLKIDVEGREEDVLRGADFTRFRPRVLVIEATRPNSNEPNHEGWEPLLLAAGYRFGLFDGLNRFYVRAESPELLPRIAAPANVVDGFVSYHEAWLAERVAELEARLARMKERRAKSRLGDIFRFKGSTR